LARYLPNGNFEFLGRIDHQVKIRGFRVELGEIESALREHPKVEQAAVLGLEEIATPNSNGSDNPKSQIENQKSTKRLAAYLVSRHEPAPTTTELRNFLKAKLPHYMLPSAFVFLPALPLTASGKVDRQALPAPEQTRPALERVFVAPRTPTESMIAEIWRELLGLDRVGIYDDFFELGGHSLLAVRLFARLEKVFGRKPPLASLFEKGTVAHLSELIANGILANGASSLVAIQPHGSKRPFFCVHEFFGDVLCYVNLARHLGPEQPFYGIEARGLNGDDEPFTDVENMAACYIGLMKTVQPRGPYRVGGLCFGGVIAFEIAQQLTASGEQVALVALMDSGVGSGFSGWKRWRRFLGNLPSDFGPWLRGCLELTPGQWRNLLRYKHAVAKANARRFFPLQRNPSRLEPQSSRLRQLGELASYSERHLAIARAQSRALRSYKPQPYSGRLTLFRARMQPFFSCHDPDKGWNRLAAGGLDIRSVPGNHLAMLQEPHVKAFADELRACLDKAK
jgi:thioesterase domain-containing protein